MTRPTIVSARSRLLVSRAGGPEPAPDPAPHPPTTPPVAAKCCSRPGPPVTTVPAAAKVSRWLQDNPSSVSELSIPASLSSPVKGLGLNNQKRPAVPEATTKSAEVGRPDNVSTSPAGRLPVKRALFKPVSNIPIRPRSASGKKRSATALHETLRKKRKASDIQTSPGTNWRQVDLPTFIITTEISPNKNDDESVASTSPWKVTSNIKILKTPNKTRAVPADGVIPSPVSQHFDEEALESFDYDMITTVPVNTNPSKPTKTRMVMDFSKECVEFYEEDVEDDPSEPLVEENPLEPQVQVPPQPEPGKRKKRVEKPRANAKKRVSQPQKWNRNEAKQSFNAGIEYIKKSGETKRARAVQDACDSKCNRCARRLTDEERQTIFESFWSLESVQKKRDLISRLVIEKEPETCSTSPENARRASRVYNFIVDDSEEVRVCKKMFINTLDVPDCWIETTFNLVGPQGLSEDKRGRHKKHLKISEATLESVRNHIKSFPTVYSHYTRERTKREYLETHVQSVERMYSKSYLEYAAAHNVEKVASLNCYRKIFNEEFNLGFFVPRKDQCETCNKWRHCKDQNERKKIVTDYGLHLKNKKAVNTLHKQDSKNAKLNATKNDFTICVACFDLQKVLICPRSETSIMFYLNKLSVFNFTVFDVACSQGHCYVWTEVDAGKGANEVGTCVLNFISQRAEEGVKEFIFYSDAPSGQNRNRMIFSMYLYAAAKYQVKITHRFLESGHSYSEADSIHARIEKEAAAKQEIFSPEEWITLIKNAKQEPPAYKVTRLENQDVLDLHFFVNQEKWTKDTSDKQVLWSKVREVIADHVSPNIISYRYNFDDEPSKVKITLKAGGVSDMGFEEFPLAYEGRIPLKPNKKKDIRTLMEKNAIPSQYFEVYEDFLSV